MAQTQQKLIDFNNPVFKTLLARNFNIKPSQVKNFILPIVGETITLGNVIYKITYVRDNPFRFSCEPVGILEDEEFVKRLEEATGKAPSKDTDDAPFDIEKGEPETSDEVAEQIKNSNVDIQSASDQG